MLKKSLFAALLLIVYGCGGGSGSRTPSTDACSLLGLPALSLRIINGSVCGNLEDSPVVRVVTVDRSQRIRTFCTGTMITTQDVLTAAHCFARRFANTYISYGASSEAVLVEADSVQIHPGYTALNAAGSDSTFNDVAVIHLSQTVPLPVLGVLVSRPVREGSLVSIFGYGSDENGIFDGIDLKSGQMLVNSVTENHIIAVFDGEGSNTCQGDSGGPLVASVRGVPLIAGVAVTGTLEGCGPGDQSYFINLHSQEVRSFLEEAVDQAGLL